MVTDRYTDNRTENGIRLYSCLVYVMSKPPQWQKKKKLYIITRRWEGSRFFFFLRPFTILYFIPRLLSPAYLRRPRTCSCTPGTDYPKSRRGGLYNMYIRFSFFCQFISLSLLLGRNPSLSIPICPSLFYRLLWWFFLKYIYIHIIRSFSFAGRVSFVRARIRVYIYIHTHIIYNALVHVCV